MIFSYDITDWYWTVQTKPGQVYSSKSKAYVPLSDATYEAWLANGASPTFAADEPSLAQIFVDGYPAGWPSAMTTIAPEDFINRFSSTEQQAILTAAQGNWQISLWLTKATAAITVDTGSAQTMGGMAALVSAGILTQARSTQILNLAVASP